MSLPSDPLRLSVTSQQSGSEEGKEDEIVEKKRLLQVRGEQYQELTGMPLGSSQSAPNFSPTSRIFQSPLLTGKTVRARTMEQISLPPMRSLGTESSYHNPSPQQPPGDPTGRNPVLLNVAPKDAKSGTTQEKFVVIMVGLPARGKTHIARRLARYLNFFHGVPTKIFNVGEYRRIMCGERLPPSFFDHKDEENLRMRNAACKEAVKDLEVWMNEAQDCRVGFFDATNSTKERRAWIASSLEKMASTIKFIFLESLCTDAGVIEENIRKVKLGCPDFKDIDADKAFSEFQERIQNYSDVYETIDPDDPLESEWMWIKIQDCKRFTINNVRGFLATQMVMFLMHTHNNQQPFYLTRHGQSEYNLREKIGGDSDLSPAGIAYAKRLAVHAKEKIHKNEKGEVVPTRLWTSTLCRTKQTAQFIERPIIQTGDYRGEWTQFVPREWRNLDEIYAGECDGMTYEDINFKYPEEFAERKCNKLAYRYPRGESYLDLIHRLHNCILEMERSREPILIVGHQAVLRIIYAYWMGCPKEEAPHVSMPLNTIIKLVPQTYGCGEERQLLLEDEEFLLENERAADDSKSGVTSPTNISKVMLDPPSH